MQETMRKIVQDARIGKSGIIASFTRSKRAHSQSADSTSTSPTKKQKTLSLNMKHAQITYTLNDVPAPPRVEYASDISTLFRDWDDETRVQVHVKNVCVPVRYWGKLYKGHMSETWTIIKQHYSNWKVRFNRAHMNRTHH